MVTEYVTGRHWDTLGAVQRANPDLVIWPGREVITTMRSTTSRSTCSGEAPKSSTLTPGPTGDHASG